MKKSLLFWGVVYCLCFPLFLGGAGKEICAEGVGSGSTRQKALHDAMRAAIRHAVGMYVTARSELRGNDYNENITIASDAVVTNYKELEAAENNGTWNIKIKAWILPNELLKYCPKLISQEVSDTEIGNLLNKRDALRNTEKVLQEIFKDYEIRLFKFQKYGEMQPDSSIDLHSEEVAVKINFIASMNQMEFQKIRNRLCALLDKVALQKANCTIYFRNEEKKQYRRSWPQRRNASLKRTSFLREIPPDLGLKLWEKAGLCDSDWKWSNMEIGFIAVKYYKNGVLYYSLYLVPAKIRELLQQALKKNTNEHIVCSLYDKGGHNIKRYFFSGRKIVTYNYDDSFRVSRNSGRLCSPLTFSNTVCIQSNHRDLDIQNERFCFSTKGSMRIVATIDDIKCTQDIYIYVLKNDISQNSLKQLAQVKESNFFHKNKNLQKIPQDLSTKKKTAIQPVQHKTQLEQRMTRPVSNTILQKEKSDKVMEQDGSLILEMGLDNLIRFELKDGKLLAGYMGSYGGVGSHYELQQKYPDLYFGKPACRAGNTVWDFQTPLTLSGKPSKIKNVKLLRSNRNVTIGSSLGKCWINWDSSTIRIADREQGTSVYKIQIYFSNDQTAD